MPSVPLGRAHIHPCEDRRPLFQTSPSVSLRLAFDSSLMSFVRNRQSSERAGLLSHVICSSTLKETSDSQPDGQKGREDPGLWLAPVGAALRD